MTLELRGVVRHYRSAGETVRAVDGADLTVDAGEVVALYGPSGSGKSTLLNLAAALDRPDAGTVTFDGERIDQLDGTAAARYRRSVAGVVTQSPLMIGGASARDNAALTLLAGSLPFDEALRRADRWLTRVGIGQQRARLPRQLSGGERQRVAIARALAIAPRLLLADEPTGSLDTDAGRKVLELLHSVAVHDGTAVLLVTHDPAAAEIADRALDMRDGRVLARRGLDATSDHAVAPTEA